MGKGLVVAAMLLVVSVMADISRKETAFSPPLSPQGWYEQQVEEGFGHIDALPKN